MFSRTLFILILAVGVWKMPAQGQEDPVVPAEETSPILGPRLVDSSGIPQPLQGPLARPESRVRDEAGLLSPDAQAELARELNAAAPQGLGLYWIALRSAEGLPAQDPAGTLAGLWAEEPVTVVILQVPGQPLAAGRSASRLSSIQQDEIAGLVQSALATGQTQMEPGAQGPAAVRHLMNAFLRYRAGHPLSAVDPRNEPAGSAAGHRHQQRIFAGGVALIGLLGLLLYLRHRRRRRPRLFPFTVARERFSAPHSGGNNAMISFAGESDRPRR